MARSKLFSILAANVCTAFMSEACDVVLVKGKNGPLRVNKSDFDADQASDKPQYTEYTGKDSDDLQSKATETFASLGIDPVAAPSAPDFSGKENGTAPLPIDPEKNAVAPAAPSINQRLVMKEGRKFFVVDGTGTKLKAEDVGGELDETGYTSKEAADAAIMKLPR